MGLSVTAHHTMLDHLAGLAGYVGLVEATTLAADVAADATEIQVQHLVQAGDSISLNDGGREPRLVTAVSGSGPYTLTLDTPTSFAHGVNTPVGHAPRAAAALREAGGDTYARQAITWGAAASEALDSSGTQMFEVQGDTTIGAFLLSAGASAGSAYYGAFLTGAIESLGAAGRYELTDADIALRVLVDE